jgi:hypothetical protein
MQNEVTAVMLIAVATALVRSPSSIICTLYTLRTQAVGQRATCRTVTSTVTTASAAAVVQQYRSLRTLLCKVNNKV